MPTRLPKGDILLHGLTPCSEVCVRHAKLYLYESGFGIHSRTGTQFHGYMPWERIGFLSGKDCVKVGVRDTKLGFKHAVCVYWV